MQLVKRILPILASLLYVVSPIDAVPDFLPGLGWVDDLLVIGFLLWYLSHQQPGRSPWDVFQKRMQGPWTRPTDAPRPEDLTADFSRMDPYALLEIPRTASPEEIKSAYKRAVGRYHPDKVAHLGKEFQELAHKKLLAIQQAYETLTAARRQAAQ
jgi:DnaJ-domain-containing protein 1